MAEDASDDDKTEEPTARRLEKAREDGQVPRSSEATAATVTISALAMLYLLGPWIGSSLAAFATDALTFDRRLVFSEGLLPGVFLSRLGEALLPLVPVFVLTMVMALLGGAMTGGFLFSPKAAAPKFSKLNPLSGLKRMFGLKALVELGKALAKFTLVAGVVYLMLDAYIVELVGLGLVPYESAVGRAGAIVALSALVASLALALIAAVDVPFQRYDFFKRMRMTLQEVKDEMKDMEGRPEVRAAIRRKQRELAAARMLGNVKDADVVITNPEHFAVALSYALDGDMPPMVVAKGVDQLALSIRQQALHHGISQFEAPELARAVYYTTEVDEAIPEPLFFPVAQVIAYVFKLEASMRDGRIMRPKPKVPESYRYSVTGEREGSVRE
jgi:flagellar biosynthesis protein FlhB